MNHGISFTLGFICAIVGVGIGSSAAYWVDAPTSPTHRDYSSSVEYERPICPPKHEPVFSGVVLISGKSHPIYECILNGNTESRVRWESLEQASPTPEPTP